MRLASLVHLDLELRMGRGDSLEQPVERRRLGAAKEGQERARLCEQAGDDAERDVGEVVSARNRLAVGQAEPLRPPDREAVELTSREARVTSPVATAAAAAAMAAAFSAAVRVPS